MKESQALILIYITMCLNVFAAGGAGMAKYLQAAMTG